MRFWRFSNYLVFIAALFILSCSDTADDDKAANKGWETDEKIEVGTEVTPVPEPDPEPEPQAPRTTTVGTACTSDADCGAGDCLTGPDWPDGYCTVNCDEDCGDAVCLDQTICAARCNSDDECRSGYMCDNVGAAASRVCVVASGAPDGEACAGDTDCAGGSCITDWDGGYCTTVGCTNYVDCARQGNENRCLQNPRGDNFCVRICEQDSECRPGFVCQQLTRTQGMCAPDPRQPLDPDLINNNPFDVQCTTQGPGLVSFDFNIAPDSTSYMVTPFNPDGGNFRPDRIRLPAGDEVELLGVNGFQAIPAQIYGGVNPTIVPATENFVSQLQSGTHTYDITSQSSETCWYVLEESETGNVLDLNVYFVGLDNLDATNGPTDPDLQEVLAGFDNIYQQAGFNLGNVRYYDVDPNVATRFSFVRDTNALPELVAESIRPGTSIDDVLSVNVFFVRGIAGSVLGVSQGLPGAAGWHGAPGSGVIFTSQYLGSTTRDGFGNSVDGNTFTAQVMAHEVGHFLGLFHTSEQTGRSHDPLDDTPECTQISGSCPDIGNLMFPFAAAANSQISEDQAFMIGVNPLTKPGPVDPNDTDPNSGAMP